MSKYNVEIFSSEPRRDKDGYDDAVLARVGKKAVLKRNFGSVTILGFSCVVLITWESALQVFLLGLQNGGPGTLVYGYLIVWLGTLSVFATLSELVSMAPTSSGQYHWVAMLAPVSARRALSYVTGWLTVCGWQALVASGGFITATLIQGLMVLTHPSYLTEWKNWHGTLMYWAVILICVFINTFIAKLLPKFEGLLLVIHILGFFGVAIPLIVLAEHSDTTFVFKTFIFSGGWPSNGLSFCIGLLGNVFAFMGADAAMHMAEEIYNAPVVVPNAILQSIVINGAMGLAMMIVVLYCISDIDLALAENPMYPIMSIFRQALGSVSGAAVMSSVLVVMAFSATTGIMSSSSRIFWAFSRDHGLPGWRFIDKVDRRTGIPLNAVAATSVIACLLAFVNIGNPTAFNGVVSLTIASLFGSYLLACGCLLWRRFQGDIGECEGISTHGSIANTMGGRLVWGPWKLPERLGIANNILACCYLVFILFFSFWPSTFPVTLKSMNWAILVTGVVVAFSAIYYALWGKRAYAGPVVEVLPIEAESLPRA
ncbi:hypothetical protein PMIN06_007449 [Paraphaeosphaeria minitans]